MKKTIGAIGTMLLVIGLFAGCQATPQQPIVIQKDTEQMIEKARETLPPEQEKLPLAQRYAVKEHLTKQIERETARLLIEVDADVCVPGTDAVGITHVVPANFSQETVSAFFHALCGDTIMYKPSLMTKAWIEQAILRCEAELAREDITEGDKAQVEHTLEAYKKQYITAPERAQKEICDGLLYPYTFEKGDFYNGCTQEMVIAYEIPESTLTYANTGKVFQVYNNLEQPVVIEDNNGKKYYRSYSAHMEYNDFDYYVGWDSYWEHARKSVKNAEDLTADEVSAAGITLEEAVALGETLFTKTQSPLSVQYVTYVASEEPFYELTCSRQVNGANLIVGGEGVGGDGLSPYWAYERIVMCVNGNGIFYFYWYSPYEIREDEVENATLLRFEEIENIAYNMIATIYGPGASKENYTTVRVEKVSLELARLKHSENNSEALLVPVWCFYGSRQVDEAVKNEGMWSDWESGYSSLLVLNAIDGSVIDLEKGY